MNILLGVSASIALYKSCDLVRELSKRGHRVEVVMTRTAASWVSPLVFSALSGRPVITDENPSLAMPHIDLRQQLDLYLVAPATADLIARAASGRADDIVAATLLSYSGPRWLAPAMNPHMYAHPALQANLQLLKQYGYRLLSPASGEVLCGDQGEGKMMPVSDIIAEIEKWSESR